jgi:hypothetical protein
MSKTTTKDELDMSDAQKEAESEDAEKQAEYERLMKKLDQRGQINIEDYKPYLMEDEITARKAVENATEQDVEKETTLLLGSKKDWSTESDEIILFRKTLDKVRSLGDQKTGKLHLPPSFKASGPIPPELNKKFICKVNFRNCFNKRLH